MSVSSRHHRTSAVSAALLALIPLALAAGGCSLIGTSSDSTPTDPAGGPTTVTLATHDSFSLPKRLIADFEEQSGYRLRIVASGDAGELTNKLVLTESDPIADVAFGVDNTFAGRALAEGVFADSGASLPDGAADYRLSGVEDPEALAPVDTANVCVNVDTAWYLSLIHI